MGNLGWYQVMTTLAKKVGGPKNLLALTLTAGGAIAIPVWELSKKGYKSIKEKFTITSEDANKIYCVQISKTDNQNLTFELGDKFTVLGRDKDVVMINIIERKDNPFCVSATFLESISDFVTS